MNEMLGWIKNHKVKTALVILALFSLPLIIVHLLFNWSSGYYFMSAKWPAGDVIGYIVGFETFLSTAFLGIVAYIQNKNHNRSQINSEAANTLTPFLVIKSVVSLNSGETDDVCFKTSHYKVKGQKAVIHFENIGQGLAANVSYKHWFGRSLPNPEDNQININLDINKTFKMNIRIKKKNENKIVSKDIEYQNIIGFRYKQTLTYKLVCERNQNAEDDSEEEYFLHVYLLGKQQRMGFDGEITNN